MCLIVKSFVGGYRYRKGIVNRAGIKTLSKRGRNVCQLTKFSKGGRHIEREHSVPHFSVFLGDVRWSHHFHPPLVNLSFVTVLRNHIGCTDAKMRSSLLKHNISISID